MSQIFLQPIFFLLILILSGCGGTKTSQNSDVFAKNISAIEAYQLIHKNPSLVILDVRTLGEFVSGHVAKAVNLDFYALDFDSRL